MGARSACAAIAVIAGHCPALAQTDSGFPSMELARGDTQHEWAFSVDEGTLTCVDFGGQYNVFFAEPWPARASQPVFPMVLPRSVVVSTNPIALFASYEDRALYAPYATLEELLRRLAPFEAMGQKLCLDAEDKEPR
jgi:hypothetical protein